MAQLELKGVHKSYGPVKTIHGVDLSIGDGEFVVFVGPSGCGKSTLLRMIAGLEEITDGTVSIDGKVVNDVPAADRGLAMVFQSYALYPHMSVYQNMAFGLENMGLPRPEIEKRVQRATTMLQLEPYLQRKPKMLSGGQRQRVAIGRAIVRDPKIFLFDEPLSNLDAELRVAMRKELSALHAEIGGTMIYVTHDQVEAMTLADRIVVLRAGRIEQVGTPLDLYHRPANQFVAGFIGSPRMNFLKGTVAAPGTIAIAGGRSLDLPAAAGLPAGEEVTVGIRPEHVALCGREDADVMIRLDLVEHLGGETYLYGQSETLPSMTIKQDGDCAATRGDMLPLRLVRDRLHLFDSAGLVRRAA
ncbi:ABC transporter ATP-binding protein [uncultured Alsobacter sp.]|uniref:ABC transporter ATP-binding protein n=1 Tax=uncultured Alsobacter sp. TaxID=1748258 RepID=UPI0025D96BAB|nr:sn-glycerol-3-phosphate ABC transporter ATP-binding protein UgpC [uncultured Alsobacter sp.]